MTEKWFAKRQSVTARTDEDAAMGSKTAGPYTTEGLAHVGLTNMIMSEITGWQEMGLDAPSSVRALARVCAGETDVTEDGVRWHIVNVGQPASPIPSATHKVGDRLHFRPTPERAPFGTIIDEGDVTVVEVVDHGSATAHSPRFTYVVRAANGETQGTDDRELFGIDAAAEITIPDVTVAQRVEHFIRADKIATEVGNKLSADRRLDLADFWDFSPNADRAKLLRELATELAAHADAMDAATGFEALSRTPTECRNCAAPISLRFAEPTSSDWEHIATNLRSCGRHYGAAAVATPKTGE